MNKESSNLVYEKPQTLGEGSSWLKENLIAILILLALLGVIVSISFFNKGKVEEERIVEQVKIEKSAIAESIFSNLDIEAKAYVVFDARSGEIVYSNNKNVQLPLASLSKIMTAVVVAENLKEDSLVRISAKDLLTEGESGLLEGELWNSKNLRDFTLVVSSNDGASALASAVEGFRNSSEGVEIRFTDLMNDKAKQLYMRQTYFLNPSGLDVEETTQSGSYGSAEDVVKLFAYALENHPHIFEATLEPALEFTSENDLIHSARNTNQETYKISGILGSKTGYTDLAGGNLVVAFDAGLMQPYIISVLGSSVDGRFSDVETLYKATRDFLETQSI